MSFKICRKFETDRKMFPPYTDAVLRSASRRQHLVSMRSIHNSKFLAPAQLFFPCLGRCRTTAENEAETSDAADDRVFEPPPCGGRAALP